MPENEADKDAAWRHMVATMLRSRRRVVGVPPKFPSDWQPYTVISPIGQMPFTENEAFEFIASSVESGAEITAITLRQPPGETAYVMRVAIPPSQLVYIKFQVKGVLVVRSFHLDLALVSSK